VKTFQIKEFLKTHEAKFQGKRGTLYIGGGADYHQISVSPNESQFLDTQRFSIQQVCRIYGVPPECIAGVVSGQSVTYANLEERGQDLLRFGVTPWLIKLEHALNDLVPRTQYCKFNASSLVRPDLATRYASYEVGLRNGFMTINQVRELEDWEPLPAADQRPRLEAVA
jgi:HK97 family phage portal protein